MSDLARFFLQTGQLDSGRVRIYGDDAHHITRVLRLRVNDKIECVNQDGKVYQVRLAKLGSEVIGVVEGVLHSDPESPLVVTLYQGLAKGDKMDLVIQKAVELGAAEIIPFTSSYTVVKLEDKRAKARHQRWQRIALEAAKQSGRTRVPEVSELHSFPEVVNSVQGRQNEGELAVLAYEAEKTQGIKALQKQPARVSVIVGPEGGFAPEEVESLKFAGAKTVTLGPRILRTETAGLVLLSIIGYRWGDLG